MKLKIWTVAADDDYGTRATVHLSEKEAYQQWLELRFSGDEPAEKDAARTCIERADYDGLWKWQEDDDPFDTYTIEEHEIELPSSS